ncbi:MAG: histidinol-phosphate transaminase [Gammaproteobacteria bacterium]|nr:histidinol-phosphate transaminase [Gammaproteobacteria bacterium]MCW5582387.1 histidinol-phosphate transaminase [Gammaproteobacteria bacterium]
MTKIDFRSLANHSVRNLTPYQPGKPIEELERELGITSSIKLASNENPLGPSHKVILAAQEALQNTHFYPDGGCYELKQALSKFLSVSPEQITVGNGSENILELIVKAYLHKNDTAVLSQYAFLTIPILLQSYGVIANVVPAKNWGHDIHSMVAAIDEKTRVLFLVNPNNPTGTFINEKDFITLMQSIPPHVLVVVDEAYSEYISNSECPNTLKYLSQYPNLVITRTFSKAYGLAALRLGYSISSPEIADILNRSRLPFNVNTIAAKAACIALEDQNHVRNSIALNNQGMQQYKEGLCKLSLDYIPSICNFITIDVNDGIIAYQKLLHEGVIVRHLKAYGMPKHIRVTIGTPQQNERFLRAIQQVLA